MLPATEREMGLPRRPKWHPNHEPRRILLLFRLGAVICALIGMTSNADGQSKPSPTVRLATQAMNLPESSVTPGTVSPKNEVHAAPLPDIPPLPSGSVSLLGGTIQRVDHVRDQLTLQIFGGGLTTILFDERTHVFRDGGAGALSDLKPGLRVYVDTTLDGTKVFARSVRMGMARLAGSSNGQIVEIDAKRNELTVRDSLSPEPVKMRLAANAEILRGSSPATAAELKPGTLVTIAFTSDGGETPTVRKLSILASPGTEFIFSGHVEHLDLHRGLLVIVDPRDDQSYKVHISPSLRKQTQDLQRGTDVTVRTQFDGTQYETRSITINRPPAAASPSPQ